MTDIRNITRAVQQLTLQKQIEDENKKALESRGGAVAVPIMASKGDRGYSGKEANAISTNVYGMVPASRVIYRYEVSMKGVYPKGRNGLEGTQDLMVEIGDTRIVERRYLRARAFNYLKEQHANFIGRAELFYDDAAILYSNELLNLQLVAPYGIFEVGNLDPEIFLEMIRVRIEIKQTDESEFRLSVDEVRASISPDLSETNHYLKQYLDVLTSHDAMNNSPDFFTFSSSELYLETPFDNGFTQADLPAYARNLSHLEVGCRKSTRFVEGPGGKGCVHPAQVISLHKRDFYDPCTLLERMKKIVNNIDQISDDEMVKLNSKLAGVWVETTYGRRRQLYKVKSILRIRPHQKTFIGKNGLETTVARYFREVYNHECLDLPLVEAMVGGKECHFPAEMLMTASYQRVPTQRQDKEVESEMIKAMAVPPTKRYQCENRLKDMLRVANSQTTRAGGVSFIPERLVVEAAIQTDARVLPAPTISYGGADLIPSGSKGNAWDGGKYIRPKAFAQWSLIAICSQSENISGGELRVLADLIVHNAAVKGMVMSPPQKMEVMNYREQTVREAIIEIRGLGSKFVLIVHAHEFHGDKIHAQMKVWERVADITTQGVLIKTARQAIAEGQPVTVGNILNKMNVKMGGLNYSIKSDILKSTDLIIGIGASHPKPIDIQLSNNVSMNGTGSNGNGLNGGHTHNGTGHGHANGNGQVNGNGNGFRVGMQLVNDGNGVRFRSKRFPPSVIGYSANISQSGDPSEFIGDYILQAARRDEKPEVIAQVVRICVETFQKVRGYSPKRIIIYRNAIAEGQWLSVLKYEMPFIELTLDEMGLLLDPVVIVPSKKHRNRFYSTEMVAEDNSMKQNIEPGTVIDSIVVHPAYQDFFLCPHIALQGTAKVPRYTVLHNNIGMTTDEIQLLSNTLAYGHQIVSSPTSLPTPVYVAEEYAKRGMNVFCEWYWDGNYLQGDIEQMSWERIQREMGYRTSPEFTDRRVNA